MNEQYFTEIDMDNQRKDLRSRIMEENKEYLHERIKHFQSLIDYMSERGQRYYLEKDWFDNTTLISIEEAKKEVELAQKMEKKTKKENPWKNLLMLLKKKKTTLKKSLR